MNQYNFINIILLFTHTYTHNFNVYIIFKIISFVKFYLFKLLLKYCMYFIIDILYSTSLYFDGLKSISFDIKIFYQSINQWQNRITNVNNPKHLSSDQNPHNLEFTTHVLTLQLHRCSQHVVRGGI